MDSRHMSLEIIAEVANAHQGDPRQARDLAEAAVAAGADALKFQIYYAHELLTRDHSRYAHFEKQAFCPDVWAGLLGHFVAKGVRVYCDVFGHNALETAKAAGVWGVKVHSSDLGNLPLLRRVPADMALLLSAGGSTGPELAAALAAVGAGTRPSPPALLHGYQTYPTPVEEANLGRLAWLRQQFGSVARIGYQDHVSGDHPFAFTLPAMAVALGAEVVEKHVTLDKAAKGVDYYSSLEPAEFAEFVGQMRLAAAAMGSAAAAFAPSERTYRETVKKHWVAARDLPAGHVLAESDLAMKRVPASGQEPADLHKLLGRELLVDVRQEQMIRRDMLPAKVWACVVARLDSSRLPGKALAEVPGGMTALAHLFGRLKQMRSLDRIVLCTTTEAEDDALADLARVGGVHCHRGPVLDVLGRMLGAAEGHDVDLILRVTGDDILLDPEYGDASVAQHLEANAQYTGAKTLPSGTELEVFDADLLRAIHDGAMNTAGTEYLTTYVDANRDHIRTHQLRVDPRHARDWRLTLDTSEDYQLICKLLDWLNSRGRVLSYRLDDIVEFFLAVPEAEKINGMVRQRNTPVTVDTRVDWLRATRSLR